jgi:hypothetical protein
VVFISHTLIVRDADLNILDTIEIDEATVITRGDIRQITRTHKAAEVIERVTTIERRPS